jgi:uncharacterized protein (TIGR02452 family)
LLTKPGDKLREARVSNTRYYAYQEHLRILMASPHPVLLCGVAYSLPDMAQTLTPAGVRARYANKDKTGKGFVKLREGDMLNVAGQLVLGEDKKVRVLNMACASRPGGGVASGRAAQEEDLYRRTDLFLRTQGWQKSGTKYPLLSGNFMYHKDALVCRAGKELGFAEVRYKFRIDVLSVAAPRNPTVADGRYLVDEEAAMMRDCVESAIKASQLTAEVGILSALGCGASGHPPDRVAEFFHQFLKKERSSKVVFAIVDDHNTFKRHNRRGNVAPFAEKFADFDFDPIEVPLPPPITDPDAVEVEAPTSGDTQTVVISGDNLPDEGGEKKKKIFEGLDELIALLKAGDSDAALERVNRFDDCEVESSITALRPRGRFRAKPGAGSSSDVAEVDPLWEEEEKPYRLREAADAAAERNAADASSSGGIFPPAGEANVPRSRTASEIVAQLPTGSPKSDPEAADAKMVPVSLSATEDEKLDATMAQ